MVFMQNWLKCNSLTPDKANFNSLVNKYIMTRFVFLVFLFFSFGFFGQKTPSILELLGHEVGDEFSRHHQVCTFYERLHVAFPEETVLLKYGETNEGRDLILFFIGSKALISNLNELQVKHLKRDPTALTPIVWLSYNVHGNESSATEASMETAYKLLTEHSTWLDETLVIIDPCLNPDGRDRYVNFYKQYETVQENIDPASIEHNEPWPGGRFNHYLFDLNRDWAWLTQVESQQRMMVYNKWMPHVHVDFHEQGYNEPYYFPPAAEPYHDIITSWQREFQERIGKNHSKYFDQKGWLYFSKEIFDLLYPSYGDTYPMYNGAIGMTYEQAGSGRAGKSVKTALGDTLTLRDRVIHHVTTGLSTIEVSIENKDELLKGYLGFNQERDYKYDYYILRGNAQRLDKLKELLSKHEITFGSTRIDKKLKAWSFNLGEVVDISIQENTDLILSTKQLKGPMIQVLFEPETFLSDSLTYDITAWSLPFAYGIDAYGVNGEVEVKQGPKSDEVKIDMPNCYAYLCKWNSMNSASFLQSILAKNIAVKVAEKAFEIKGQNFPVGTLVIPRGVNQSIAEFDDIIKSSANQTRVDIYPVASGYVSKGKDFGSSSYQEIYLPKVGVLSGGDLSPINTGEIWHFFEKELDLPFRMFRISELNRRDNISDLDVILLPEGQVSEMQLEKLRDWIDNGGRLLVFGEAAYNFVDDFEIAVKDVEFDYSASEREELSMLITGAIFNCELAEKSNSLIFGYERYHSLRQSAANFSLKNGKTLLSLSSNPKAVSGFVGYKAKENQSDAMILGEEAYGKGTIVYFCDNPLFRGFWEHGKLLVANAIYFGND